jgi:hypothetical protein
MNVYFVLNSITFVWDDEKARINPTNHDGIILQQAAESFFDPFLVVVDASRNEEARTSKSIWSSPRKVKEPMTTGRISLGSWLWFVHW